MTQVHSHIGEAIKARREALGLTQEQLCQRLGWKVSRVSEVSEIENGANTNLTLRRLIALAKALDCRISELTFMLSHDSDAA